MALYIEMNKVKKGYLWAPEIFFTFSQLLMSNFLYIQRKKWRKKNEKQDDEKIDIKLNGWHAIQRSDILLLNEIILYLYNWM